MVPVWMGDTTGVKGGGVLMMQSCGWSISQRRASSGTIPVRDARASVAATVGIASMTVPSATTSDMSSMNP